LFSVSLVLKHTRCYLVPLHSAHIHIDREIQANHSITHQRKQYFTMAQINEARPQTHVNNRNEPQPAMRKLSIDEIFDRIVAEPDAIGLMVDMTSNTYSGCSLIVDNGLSEGCKQYQEALHRRVTRLLSRRWGEDRLLWYSEEVKTHTQPTHTGVKSVCCINAEIPITADLRCECCGKKDYKCPEWRKVFRLSFIFNQTPTPKAHRTTFTFRNKDDDNTVDRMLDRADRLAWDQAKAKGDQFVWPEDDMDLEWVWARISRGFTHAADNRFLAELVDLSLQKGCGYSAQTY
jgi:hypothetical protein